MADPTTYTWYAAYQAAVSADDPATLRVRIAHAFRTIEERLRATTGIDDAEYNEIQDAVLVLGALKAELPPE
jgi:hypothetical protein